MGSDIPSIERSQHREYQYQDGQRCHSRRRSEDSRGKRARSLRRPPIPQKLQLWADDGTFEDPITKAVGRQQYEPQWYGLQTAFSEIERLHHEVTSGGNPISMDLRTRYVVKGIGKEQTIDSKINIFYDKATGKITKLEDKWGGKLPDSSFQNAFRKINAVTVPKMVGVPKNDEEDAARGNQ
ncbi:hypothetical protein ABVK25_002720 [Lepraria finkii]|uniref:Uncharacterized protein n=1 Tax=Lepraria finkii TaxID=1340010 RepID=A0ABR4BGN1_9LECA